MQSWRNLAGNVRGGRTIPSNTISKIARPKLFLGSSSEAKPIAQWVARALRDVAEVHPWWSSPAFRPTRSTLQGLIDACRDFYDFGLFLLSPDDIALSRGKKFKAPRDNVWFEFGLFIGGVGDTRTFALEIVPGARIKIASDLDGIGISRLNWGNNLEKNLQNLRDAIVLIKKEIKENGRNHGSFRLVKSWCFRARPLAFQADLEHAALLRHRDRLVGQQLVLIARIEDRAVDQWNDRGIYLGKPRVVTHPIEGDIHLLAPLDKRAQGEDIYGRIFLLPANAKLNGIRTMAELRDLGGLRLDRFGQHLPARR